MPISPILESRWSPRVFDESHQVTDGDVMALAEAARWAPSSNNFQPWKFAFLKRGSKEFEAISEAGLTGFNQTWAPKASLMAVVLADQKRPDGSDWDKSIAFYNAGLASAQIVFQAEHMGLKAHYMGGIVHEKVLEIVGAKDVWAVNILAIGRQGSHLDAPADLQARETANRERKSLAEIVVLGL
jgi:nitroreductase